VGQGGGRRRPICITTLLAQSGRRASGSRLHLLLRRERLDYGGRLPTIALYRPSAIRYVDQAAVYPDCQRLRCAVSCLSQQLILAVPAPAARARQGG
jgi:hypothetical protein